ncbi:MAG: hypothetical protein QG671_3207 [Actinomycetota bacterium]|nr:hypothetical protein [Actinomycetota bacterium]
MSLRELSESAIRSYPQDMGEQPITVAVIAHGEHVADVVPSGELDRLRETVQVLSDSDLVRSLADLTPEVRGRDAIRALITGRMAREQQ